MKYKPHILLTPGGRWAVLTHKVLTRTDYLFPYTAAQDGCDARNLKEGRCK